MGRGNIQDVITLYSAKLKLHMKALRHFLFSLFICGRIILLYLFSLLSQSICHRNGFLKEVGSGKEWVLWVLELLLSLCIQMTCIPGHRAFSWSLSSPGEERVGELKENF